MFLITGGVSVVVALCAVAGMPDCWLVRTLEHVRWEGLHLLDVVFPLFMLISGITLPFSAARHLEGGKGAFLRKVCLRTAMLVLAGIVYNGFLAHGFAGARYPSVLGRIGICWGISAILYLYLGLRTRIAVAVAILVGYALLLGLVPAPDAVAGASAYSPEGNLSGWFDRLLLPGTLVDGPAGHRFDPEGVLSTLPAAVTTMGGVFVGELLRSERASGLRQCLLLLAAALVSGLLAFVFVPVCPIVKKIWTSTFVLATWSVSLFLVAVFHYVVDVRGWTRWGFFFRVIGMNSIAAYLLRKAFDFHRPAKFLFGALASCFGESGANLVDCLGYSLSLWIVLWFLYRRDFFFRI